MQTTAETILEIVQDITWAAKWYDLGRREMALQIGMAAAPLFGREADGKPLWHALELKTPVRLISTTTCNAPRGTRNIFGFMDISPGGFLPRLYKSERAEEIDWRQWWEEAVVPLSPEGLEMITRREIVSGARSELRTPRLPRDSRYQKLVDGLGVEIHGGRKGGPLQRIRLRDAHLAALRQIGYELLASTVVRSLVSSADTNPTSGGIALPPRIDIEQEMTRFVRAFGGTVVSDVVGPSPPFVNADYAFPEANIIAELKCLTDDKSEDQNLQRAIETMVNRCINSGRIPDPGPGRYVLDSVDLPRDVQDELYRLLARPITHCLMKANRQIKVTRTELNMPDAHGLVLLANDGNFRLDPAQWAHAVDVALGRDRSAIDSVIMFTVNMLATTPHLSRHAVLWMPASRKRHPRLSEEFLRRFSEGWRQHVAALTGAAASDLKVIWVDDLETTRFDKMTSKTRK